MADTPAWVPAHASNNAMTLDTPANAASTNTKDATTIEQDEKDLPSIILYMRLANMGVAAALITVSVSDAH